MLPHIMLFLNRVAELERLDELAVAREARLAVVYGRRRVGKTRLLLEWTARHGGLYTVADQSAPEVQRRYLALALTAVFPGFADVQYPDWAGLLTRLARDAQAARWSGPLVIDELPYLALGAP
jgi:AAA+ ATPase superfamily predicted ATPase